MAVNNKKLERELKALANARRLAILKFLSQNKEATVGDIAEAIKLSFRSTSRHLAILKATEIVECEQRTIFYYYRLVSPRLRSVQAVLSLV